MKKVCKISMFVLCLIMIFSVGIGATTTDNKSICYIPMDNRPVNTDRVQYLIGSIGFEVAMPGEDLYATKLDGQPMNSNRTQYGDCAALLQWVREKDVSGYDTFVISLDQVLSGGLVNSRIKTFGDDNNSYPEYNYIDSILAELSKDPNNRIYFTDTVMRLASTVGYKGYTKAEYAALREYGCVDREILSGNRLSIDNIVNAYANDDQGKPAINSLSNDKKTILTGNNNAVLHRYLQARERKLRLIDRVLNNKAFRGENIYFLIGIDDSTAGNSIQTNEVAYIKSLLGNDGVVFDGTDELGMMAISRLYADMTGENVNVSVEYFGNGSNVIGNYETDTINAVINKHLDGVGATRSAQGSADVSLLVLTPPESILIKERYCQNLVNRYLGNIKNKIPTIIIDASQNNEYQSYLQNYLVSNAPLGYLVGYSNWNTIGNATGIALSSGVSRYRYLIGEEEKTAASHNSFLKMMTFSFVKDMAYKRNVYNNISLYIQNTLGLDYENFYGNSNNSSNRNLIQRRLDDQMRMYVTPIVNNLRKSNVITDLNTYIERGISTVSLASYNYPWYRTYECGFGVVVGGLTAPHEIATAPQVETVIHKAYMNGYSDKTFRPGDSITRAEVCKMVMTLNNIVGSGYQGLFPDVQSTHWAYGHIEVAKEKGYISGYEDGSFLPNRPMTRAEFAAFLVNFAKQEGVSIPEDTKITFTDVKASDWFYESVKSAVALKMVTGYTDNTFGPQQRVTRAEAVAMTNRLFLRDLKSENINLSSITAQNPYSDVASPHWAYWEILEASILHQFQRDITN